MSDMIYFETLVHAACILGVKVGTTGNCGGDAGHGGMTVIELHDKGGLDMEVEVIDDGNKSRGGVRIKFCGDSELDVLIRALEFMAWSLRGRRDGQLVMEEENCEFRNKTVVED